MKLLLPLLTLLPLVSLHAQTTCLPVDSATHKVRYAAVVQAPGITTAELQKRAQAWLTRSLNQANPSPPVAAEGSTTALVGKGATIIAFKARNQKLYFVVSVAVKEGRYKYEITDLVNHNDAFVYGMGGNTRTIPASDQPVEETLASKRHRTRKGEPDDMLLSYCQAVDIYIKGLVNDLGKAMTQQEKDW